MTLRIGSHPHLLPLFILRHRGVLETALAAHGGVVWTDYDHAGDGAVLLAGQALDVVGTGSTLPVLAHSRGLDIAYLAASPDRAEPCALLAMKDGAHRSLQALRGARIAGMRGTVTEPFLAGLLLQHDLTLEDITLVDLNGSDAARALRARCARAASICGPLSIPGSLPRRMQKKYAVLCRPPGRCETVPCSGAGSAGGISRRRR